MTHLPETFQTTTSGTEKPVTSLGTKSTSLVPAGTTAVSGTEIISKTGAGEEGTVPTTKGNNVEGKNKGEGDGKCSTLVNIYKDQCWWNENNSWYLSLRRKKVLVVEWGIDGGEMGEEEKGEYKGRSIR